MPIRKEMQQRYPKDWALRSRFVRFYRAGNRCEWCGVHNYSLREDTGAVVVLTAAHVYDKRPEACGLLNLGRPSASGVTSATTLRPAPRAAGYASRQGVNALEREGSGQRVKRRRNQPG